MCTPLFIQMGSWARGGRSVYIYPLFETFEKVCVSGEHKDGSMIQIESQELNFLAQVTSKGEIRRIESCTSSIRAHQVAQLRKRVLSLCLLRRVGATILWMMWCHHHRNLKCSVKVTITLSLLVALRLRGSVHGGAAR